LTKADIEKLIESKLNETFGGIAESLDIMHARARDIEMTFAGNVQAKKRVLTRGLFEQLRLGQDPESLDATSRQVDAVIAAQEAQSAEKAKRGKLN
jgi:hypothetical protein